MAATSLDDSDDSMMEALVLRGVRSIAYERVPRPAITNNDGAAIVRVRVAGLCGSDSHAYNGLEECEWGLIPGHELVGIVEAIADTHPRVGDRVVCSFSTACGECEPCLRGLSARCIRGVLLGGSLRVSGAQARFVRVPTAAGSLTMLPDDISDEEGLLVADILCTAMFCAVNARVAGITDLTVAPGEPVHGHTHTHAFAHLAELLRGALEPPEARASSKSFQAARASLLPPRPGTIAIVGCGPVGLCVCVCVHTLTQLHAELFPEHAAAAAAVRIVAIDTVPERLAAAAALGVTPVNATDEAALSALSHTCVCVCECVGSTGALATAYRLAQPGGTLSSIGVCTSKDWPFTHAQVYDKNLTLRVGRCPARSLTHVCVHALRLMRRRGVDLLRHIVSHRLPLSAGPEAYDMFANRRDGCKKVLFHLD